MGEAVGDAVDKLALKLAERLGWGLQRAPQPESAKPVASTNSPPSNQPRDQATAPGK